MEDKRFKDLEQIKAVFDQFGVRVLLVYGALLGWYRDGNWLPGDDDIDLAVIDPIDLRTRKMIGWKLFDLGFVPQELAFNVFGRMEPTEIGYNGTEETGIIVCQRNYKFTIFFFGPKEDCKVHGMEYICVPRLGAFKLISSPTRFYEKLGKVAVGTQEYLTPGPIKEYLEYSYFNNWKDKNDRRHSPIYSEAHPEYAEFIKRPPAEVGKYLK